MGAAEPSPTGAHRSDARPKKRCGWEMSGERVEFRELGQLIVISGPSGSGKNSVLARVRQGVPNLTYSVSATTRAPREGELDGTLFLHQAR